MAAVTSTAAASAGVPGWGRLAVDGGTTRGVRAANFGSALLGWLAPTPRASKTPPFNSTSSSEQPPTATANKAASTKRVSLRDGMRLIDGLRSVPILIKMRRDYLALRGLCGVFATRDEGVVQQGYYPGNNGHVRDIEDVPVKPKGMQGVEIGHSAEPEAVDGIADCTADDQG